MTFHEWIKKEYRGSGSPYFGGDMLCSWKAAQSQKLPCGHPSACGEPCGWCADLAKARKLLGYFVTEPHIWGEGWWRKQLHEEDCRDAEGWQEGFCYADREADWYNQCVCDGRDREKEIDEFMQEPRP
jgi:hypothetical protein